MFFREERGPRGRACCWVSLVWGRFDEGGERGWSGREGGRVGHAHVSAHLTQKYTPRSTVVRVHVLGDRALSLWVSEFPAVVRAHRHHPEPDVRRGRAKEGRLGVLAWVGYEGVRYIIRLLCFFL